MSTCPICQKPVDPLRARYVAVRDGRIVAYCSAECLARSAEAAPPLVAPEPALEPAPAGKRTRTPASGVKTTRTPASGVKVIKEGKEAKDAKEKDGKEPEAPVAAAASAATAEPAAAEPERRLTPVAIAAAAAEATEDKAADDPSVSSIRRTRRRKDSLDARSAWEWLDDEPAEPVSPRRRRAEGESRGGRGLVVLLLLALLGGGGYLAYRYVYLPRQEGTAPPAPPPAEDAAPADAAATPEQQRQSALDRAIEVLRSHARAAPPAGDAGKPRDDKAGAQALARWMAAGALSRTGDADAIAILAGLLEKEPSESARLEISYQLARAGDPRGTERLVAALSHKNIDTRHEAARWLARLGDQRAVPVLTGAMAYSQSRLAAAEVLAYVAHPDAIKLLEDTRAAAGASAEEKARATIALGRAKRATADELRALLNDKRNAETATVLAELGDATAGPILHEQLGFEHACVEAARALRRFGDEGDREDGLRTLLAALGSDGPTAQLRAAEALLLLAGPARWSERM